MLRLGDNEKQATAKQSMVGANPANFSCEVLGGTLLLLRFDLTLYSVYMYIIQFPHRKGGGLSFTLLPGLTKREEQRSLPLCHRSESLSSDPEPPRASLPLQELQRGGGHC